MSSKIEVNDLMLIAQTIGLETSRSQVNDGKVLIKNHFNGEPVGWVPFEPHKNAYQFMDLLEWMHTYSTTCIDICAHKDGYTLSCRTRCDLMQLCRGVGSNMMEAGVLAGAELARWMGKNDKITARG